MRARNVEAHCFCRHGTLLLGNPLLFLSLVLPATSFAQVLTTVSPVASGALAATTSTSGLPSKSPNSSPGMIPSSSMITSYTSSLQNLSTPTSTSSTSTAGSHPPGLWDDQPSGNGQHRDVRDGVFNYYFLFLALFGVLVAVGLWWLHRHKKRKKERFRLSAQNALARDLDGWSNTRRWMHGGWRNNRSTTFARREEGLDENGEAPPPYQPKPPGVGDDGAESGRDPTSGLTIPLRTLSRSTVEATRPPQYEETVEPAPAGSAPPASAEAGGRRPDTADRGPNSSTHDLLRPTASAAHQ